MSRSRFVMLYSLICLIWGSTWTVIRIGEDAALDPFLGASLRFIVAGAILWTLVLVRRVPMPRGKTEWRASIINGVLGAAASYSIVYWTSQYVPSGLEAVIFGTMPLWTIVFNQLGKRGERLTFQKIFGVVLGFAGLLLIFLPGLAIGSNAKIGAMVLMLCSPFVSAITLVITKRDAKGVEPLALNAISISIAMVVLTIIAIATNDLTKVHLTFTHLWTIGYLATFGTVVTFVVYYHLLRSNEAIVMSYVSLITPVIAVLTGWLLLDEHLSFWAIAGAVAVIIGIRLTLLDKKTTMPKEAVAAINLE
jgi:drug/metabolite transporter (DMT)-like permease